jgi:hypothetical protein
MSNVYAEFDAIVRPELRKAQPDWLKIITAIGDNKKQEERALLLAMLTPGDKRKELERHLNKPEYSYFEEMEEDGTFAGFHVRSLPTEETELFALIKECGVFDVHLWDLFDKPYRAEYTAAEVVRACKRALSRAM